MTKRRLIEQVIHETKTNGTVSRFESRSAQSLAALAGVSRATVYRNSDLLDVWRQMQNATLPSRSGGHHQSEIGRLRTELQQERNRRVQAEKIAKGLALAVAELRRQRKFDA